MLTKGPEPKLPALYQQKENGSVQGIKTLLQMQSGLREAEKGMGGGGDSWVSVLLKATSVFHFTSP